MMLKTKKVDVFLNFLMAERTGDLSVCCYRIEILTGIKSHYRRIKEKVSRCFRQAKNKR
jgi:hypothetical protein